MPSTTLLNDFINGMRFTPSTTTALGATRFLALYSAAPTIAGGGTELTGNGYARVQLLPAMVGASTGTNIRSLTNLVPIIFPEPVGANWVTATHIGLHDHATNDRLIDFFDMADLTATIGFPPAILAGTLTFTSGT